MYTWSAQRAYGHSAEAEVAFERMVHGGPQIPDHRPWYLDSTVLRIANRRPIIGPGISISSCEALLVQCRGDIR